MNFDNISLPVVIRVNNIEDAIDLMEILEDNNIIWVSGKKPTERHYFEPKATYYILRQSYGKIVLTRSSWDSPPYDIIEFEEFINKFSKTPKEEIKFTIRIIEE